MKKMLLITVVLIIIPFFVVKISNKDLKKYTESEIKLDFVSNRIVRVKRVNKNRIDNVRLEEYVVGAVG